MVKYRWRLYKLGKINTYKIKMRLSGRATQLPDSQKIFGALVYFFAERTSEEKASEFVNRVQSGADYCSLSNLFPENYLPVPETYLLERINCGGKIQGSKELYKQIKRRHYVKKEQLIQWLKDPEEADNIYPYVQSVDAQSIHAAIDSVYYDMPGVDPNVFSVPEVHLLEIQREKEKRLEGSFEFYIQISLSDLGSKLIDLLYCAQMEQRPFFLGPRSSQGMNIYYIQEIIKEAADDRIQKGCCLNLGMLLPHKIIFSRSYINLFSSQRRHYEQAGGWFEQEKKRFISFINAGSIIYLSEDWESAGRSIFTGEDSKTIIFGNSFMIPLNI